jgi:hypothetical protein
VLELIPTEHVYLCSYTLSDAAGLEYGCLMCRSTDELAPEAWGPDAYDFHVNADELDSPLARITA